MAKNADYYKKRNITDSTPIVLYKNLHLNYYKVTFYGYWIGWNIRNKICDNSKLTTLTSCLSEYYKAFGFPKEVLSSDRNGYPYSLNTMYKELTSWHLIENCLDKVATVLHIIEDETNSHKKEDVLNELGTLFFIQLDSTIANLFIGFYLSDPLSCSIDNKETLVPIIDKFEGEFKFMLEEIDYLMCRDKYSYYHNIIESYTFYNNLRSTWYANATADSTPNK